MESVAGVGSGNVAFDVRVDYARDIHYPLSGLEGNLWRFALLRLDIGLSNIADLEVSGGLRDHKERLRVASSIAGSCRASTVWWQRCASVWTTLMRWLPRVPRKASSTT